MEVVDDDAQCRCHRREHVGVLANSCQLDHVYAVPAARELHPGEDASERRLPHATGSYQRHHA